MQERGVVDQIKSSYRRRSDDLPPRRQICPDHSGRPLGFNQTFTAFWMICIGVAAAAATAV